MAYDARELVERAFDAARDKGKPEWHRMHLAVLKNRLLLLSDREFDETQHGASNFRQFVADLNDLLRLDLDTTPPMVELREPSRLTRNPNVLYNRFNPGWTLGYMRKK